MLRLRMDGVCGFGGGTRNSCFMSDGQRRAGANGKYERTYAHAGGGRVCGQAFAERNHSADNRDDVRAGR